MVGVASSSLAEVGISSNENTNNNNNQTYYRPK